ncbi:hypothetical protein ABPG72_009393 [Tetrahymena utriculariae]
MDSLIPILNDLIKISSINKGRKFETLLKQPQDKMEAKRRPDLNDPNFLNYLNSLIFMQDKIQQYIEIYQSQIKEISGVSLHFDPDYEQDDVLSDVRVKSFQAKEYFSGIEKKTETQVSNTENESTSAIQNLYNSTNLNQQNLQNSEFRLPTNLMFRFKKRTRRSNQMKYQNSNMKYLQNNQVIEEDNNIKNMFQCCESKDFNQNSDYSDILNSKKINLKINSKDSAQNRYYELKKKSKQLQNLYSKDSTFNQLLLSTKTGFQLAAFQSKRLKLADENSKPFQEKEKDYPVEKESKFPITLEESQKKQNKDLLSVSSSSKSMNYFKIINAIGIISVLTTLSLTFSGFFTFYSSLISQRENFKFINWIYVINIEMSYALSETYIKMLNNQGFLETPASQNQAFNQQLQIQIQSRIELSKDNMVILYNNTNMDIEVFKIVKQKQILQAIYNDKSTFDQYNLSLLYYMLLKVAGIYHFATDQDPSGIFLQYNEQNYPNLNSQVQSAKHNLPRYQIRAQFNCTLSYVCQLFNYPITMASKKIKQWDLGQTTQPI